MRQHNYYGFEGWSKGDKFAEGAGRRFGQPLERGMAVIDQLRRRIRLGRQKCRDDADRHAESGGDIAPHPHRLARDAEPFQQRHQNQHAGAGDQHADAVGGDIAGHAGALFAGFQAFDAEGIDDDVLRRRRGRHQHRAENDQRQRAQRVAEAGSCPPPTRSPSISNRAC